MTNEFIYFFVSLLDIKNKIDISTLQSSLIEMVNGNKFYTKKKKKGPQTEIVNTHQAGECLEKMDLPKYIYMNEFWSDRL